MFGMRKTYTPRRGQRGGWTDVAVGRSPRRKSTIELDARRRGPRWDDLWTVTISDDE
jgi:hypothetical protein